MAFKKLQPTPYPRRLWSLVGLPGTGKAQPLDAQIKTPAGWVRMGDVRIGDAVCSPDGQPSWVTGVHPQGMQAIYRLTFVDGRSTCATADHLWQVLCKFWTTPRVITTAQLRIMLAQNNGGTYANRLYVPLLTGDVGAPLELPIDPYVLGVLLGDGCLQSSSPSYTKPDAEIADAVGARLQPGYHLSHVATRDRYSIVQENGQFQKGVQGVTQNYYRETLRTLGLLDLRSCEKFVPPAYLAASQTQRLDLVRGLLDTDGTVGTGKTVSFTTTSLRLALDTQQLIRSLGGLCLLSPRQPFYTHNGERRAGRPAFTLNIRHPQPEMLFTLPRKRERTLDNQYAGRLKLRLDKIEPCGEAACQCITVSHPAGLYITDDYVVTHNSTFAMQMRGPVLMIDADHRADEVARLCAAGVYQLSERPMDHVDAQRIADCLRAGMPDSDIRTIVVDSLTAIMAPLVTEAILTNDAGENRNRMAAFKAKALAMRLLQDAVGAWGTDVLYIYHFQTGRDQQAKEQTTATVSRTELARLVRSINLQLSLVVQNGKRGVHVDWARRGRADITLWDTTGTWTGMPEKIEAAVYDGLSKADQDQLETAIPKGFTGPEHAISWGMDQGCFTALQHARNAYDELKREAKPQTAQEMWDAWIADVLARVAKKRAADATAGDDQQHLF